MRINISGKAFIAFGVSLSILIGLTAYSYINSHQLIESKKWGAHTSNALYLTEQILSSTLEIEMIQLKYALSPDSTFLKTFRQTVTDLNEHIDKLLLVTKDNTKQQNRIEKMQLLIKQKIKSTEAAIITSSTSNDIMIADSQLMNDIRTSLSDIESEEKNVLKMHEAKDKTQNSLFNITSIGLLVVGIGILISFFISVNYNIGLRIDSKKQIKDLNTELESFTYSISHDLRAPLRSVSGYAKILKEDYTPVLNDEGNRILEVIQNNALRMGMLIDNLLEFARVGRREVVKSRVNMDEVVHSLVRDLQQQGVLAEFKINTIHSGNADVTMIRQVWTNLLSNAVKFSGKNDVAHIEINSSVTANQIEYSVRDNGTGFNMDYVNKLFNVFQRLHKVEDYEGTGIGLALVKRIINRHGGQVRAEGRENDGAIFYFTLPQ